MHSFESNRLVYCFYWWEGSQLTCSHLTNGNGAQWRSSTDKFSLSTSRLDWLETHTMSRQRCEPFSMHARERDNKDLESVVSLIWRMDAGVERERETHQSKENKCTRWVCWMENTERERERSNIWKQNTNRKYVKQFFECTCHLTILLQTTDAAREDWTFILMLRSAPRHTYKMLRL